MNGKCTIRENVKIKRRRQNIVSEIKRANERSQLLAHATIAYFTEAFGFYY